MSAGEVEHGEVVLCRLLRRRPLAAATIARIQAGIDRYWNRPGVLDVQRDRKLRDPLGEPCATQTGRQSQALYLPLLVHLRCTRTGTWAAAPAW